MKLQRSMLAVYCAALAFSGSALAKGGTDNPTQVEVLNFPATQNVAVTNTPSVSVSNMPTVVVDDSTPIKVNVTDSPSTYSFVGYTDTDHTVIQEQLYTLGQLFCKEQYGDGARIATGKEMRKMFETVDSEAELVSILPPQQGTSGFGIPYGYGWFTKDESIDDVFWIDTVAYIKKNAVPDAGPGDGAVACSTPDS
ncbi:MAG: hypothetical protein PVG42_13035 [Lysobacterales bacterium]|jgi:hypothetical protein